MLSHSIVASQRNAAPTSATACLTNAGPVPPLLPRISPWGWQSIPVPLRYEHELTELVLQAVAEKLAFFPLAIALHEHVVQLQEICLEQDQPIRHHPARPSGPPIALRTEC